MLALRLAWRNFKSGELRLLAAGLMLAVTVVSAVALFTDRLDNTLTRQSNSLLGADKIIRSSQPINPDWTQEAHKANVTTASSIQFNSMVFANDTMQLASIRAVSEGYPLRGQIEISTTPFANQPELIENAKGIPEPGDVWVDSRLLPSLGIQLGQKINIGEAEFTATRVIIREPDSSNPFSFMGVGVMINHSDLDRTEVIQPGSRVQYQWLLAAEETSMTSFSQWLKPRLSKHETIVDINSSQRGVSRTLSTARQFLLLAAVMGVLLAGVTIAMAARQFALKHTDQVALLKSFGVSSNKIRSLYSSQLIAIAIIASFFGLLFGELFQHALAIGIKNSYQVILAPAHLKPYITSFTCGLVCLICFAMPALWFLPTVPPIKILRSEDKATNNHILLQILCAFLALLFLTSVFSQDARLSASVLGALIALVIMVALVSFGALKVARRLARVKGNSWRLALANLQRRFDQTVILLTVFSVAIMLLVTLVITRTSLLSQWQQQVPEAAPNHFLVNIAAHEKDAIAQLLTANQFQSEPVYPMVRGRLVKINQQEPSEEQRKLHRIYGREANLTWANVIGEDNKLVAGQWWESWQSKQGLPGISIEQELAADAAITLGDVLTFSIGGLEVSGEVASIRKLDWRSMKPNFFFVFEPNSLDRFAPTYITSFYLPPDKKIFINDLLRTYPTVLVIEMDKIINQIKVIVTQTSNGVLLVLLLIMTGCALALLSAINATMTARKQEVGLLRALGISRNLMLGSILLEFSLLGFIAGTVAVIGAEILLLSLQHFVFEMPIQPHFLYWFISPLLGAIFIGSLGTWRCGAIIQTPPGIVLREAA